MLNAIKNLVFSKPAVDIEGWSLISKLPYVYKSSSFYSYKTNIYTTKEKPEALVTKSVSSADCIVYNASRIAHDINIKAIGCDITTKEILMEISKDDSIKKYNYITIKNTGKNIITLVNDYQDVIKDTVIEYKVVM